MENVTTKSFTCHCHCKTSAFDFTVPSASLPLSAHTCHCSICRHSHGAIALFHCKLPLTPSPDPRSIKSLIAYRAVSGSDVLRFFCSTCGSHLISLAEEDEDWFVSTACVEGGDENVFMSREAIFVSSSVDGGLSDWLPTEIRKWEKFWHTGEPLSNDKWKRSVVSAKERAGAETILNAHCQCEGVGFKIHRPHYASGAFRRHFPDLVLPPEDRTQRDMAKERREGTWWIASDRSKYKASNCVCTSDRLSSGCEVMQWAFVPTSFIALSNDSSFKNIFGTLKEYESSPGIYRRFCSTCGALVFWHDVNQRPYVIDVAVGVLDSPAGARAEDWLEWKTKSITYIDDAVNKKLANDLQIGLNEWGKSVEAS